MTSSPTIAAVRLTPVLVADPPLLNTQGVHQPQTPRLVIEVETTGGVVGLGETYGDGHCLALAARLAEALKGHPVANVNLLLRIAESLAASDGGDLDESVSAGGLRGAQSLHKLVRSVVSGFEVACLDALGRTLGLPVHVLLGGKVRDQVPYAAYLFYKWDRHPGGPVDHWGAALDPAGLVAQARRMVELHGFDSFKLKGGVFPPEQEVAAIRALAEAFPGRPLRLDPNGAWSVPTALRVAEQLSDVLEYLEDPTAGTAAMAELAARSPLPLATNMCVTGFEEVREAFTAGAVQVVLSDHHYWGGLRATQQLAAVCRTFGVGLSMHSNTHLGISLAAMTQVAATLPNLDHPCDSHYPWLTEDVITSQHRFHSGSLTVTDTPGLGVELDRTALERLHRRWTEDDGTLRERDDTAAIRRAVPGWTSSTW